MHYYIILFNNFINIINIIENYLYLHQLQIVRDLLCWRTGFCPWLHGAGCSLKYLQLLIWSRNSVLLQNPYIYYCVHKSLPLDPVLRQFSVVQPFMSCFSKTNIDIILIYTPVYIPFRFSNHYFVSICNLLHSSYMPHITHLLDFITLNNVWHKLQNSFCSFLHSPVSSSPLGPNILNSTLFPVIISRCYPFLRLRDKVSHSYNITIKLQLCIFQSLSF